MKIQSVSRAFAILNYISDHNGAGVSEISRALDLNKSTTFGLIKTMEAEGILYKNDVNDDYFVSLKLYKLAANGINTLGFKDMARPFLRKLSDEFGETIHLVMVNKNEAVYIEKIESTKSIRIITRIGDELPLHATGVGKAILAYRSDAQRNFYIETCGLQKYTDKTITSPSVLKAQLEEIKINGYAIDNEEKIDELYCVAVPILNRQGEPKYGVSISMPVYRATEDIIVKMVEALMKVKKELEEIVAIG